MIAEFPYSALVFFGTQNSAEMAQLLAREDEV